MSTPLQSTICVALLQQWALDCDGLAALLQNDSRFKVVARSNDLRKMDMLLKLIQPHVTIIDTRISRYRTFSTGQHLLSRNLTQCVLFLDDEPNAQRAKKALSIKDAGYLTRKQNYEEISNGLVRLIRGDRPIDPVAARWMNEESRERLEHVRIDPPALSFLTDRDVEIIRLLSDGNSISQCADILGIPLNTADSQKSRVMKKMRVHKAVDLVRLAIREGLIEP